MGRRKNTTIKDRGVILFIMVKKICIRCKKNEVVYNNNIPLLCCYNCYERYYNNRTWKKIKKELLK